MEINSKQLIALAAIGAAVWYFTRKNGSAIAAATKPAIAPAAGTGGIWDGFGVGGSLSQAMGQDQVSSTAVAAPNKPAAAPAPVAQPWEAQPIVNGAVTWNGTNGWNQANGQPVAEGYAFAHLTPEQRAGRTDAQMVSKYA